MSNSHAICLFCGSRTGHDPAFVDAAVTLGETIAGRGHRLIYGAGDSGLMGTAARSVQSAGGYVAGVIPQHLVDAEVGKSDVDDYIVTDTMHQRKMLMFERSEAVIALPGGPGTLDELIEVLTWRQLGLHTKPTVILNINGYWDPFMTLLSHVIDHGFADRTFLDYLTVAERPEEAVEIIERKLAG